MMIGQNASKLAYWSVEISFGVIRAFSSQVFDFINQARKIDIADTLEKNHRVYYQTDRQILLFRSSVTIYKI